MAIQLRNLAFVATLAACAAPKGKDSDADAKKAEAETAKPAAAPVELPIPSTSFERAPYIARATLGGTEILLVGHHAKPDAAVAEANWVDDVYEWAASKHGNKNALILGDLNLSCDYASAEQLAGLDLRKDAKYHWLVPDDADTNVAETKCAYDRIIAVGDAFATAPAASIGTQEIKHSDHKPVGVDIGGISVGSYNLQVFGDSKSSDSGALGEAAAVVCTYDLALVVEIVSEDSAPADLLLAEVKKTCGDDHEMKLSDPTGVSSHKERLAYIFRTGKVGISEAFLFPQASATAAQASNPAPAPASPSPAPAPAPAPTTTADCGIDQYITPSNYCYATKDGKKKRVADSCCGI